MSMPLQSGPPADATVEAPAAPAVEAPATVEEPPALHPAWVRTLDEAGIPDMLRPKLIEQIRRSEAEANQAVEKAKSESVDPTWREFIEMSKGVNASPEDLVRSWNATQEMINDPFGHMDRFTAQVDELVKAGKMPARQAAAVKADEQQQVNEIIGLDTPEQQQIAALQKRLDDQDTQRAKQTELDQADEYANLFYGELDKATNGLDIDEAGKNNLRDIADTALFNDTTGKLTPAVAIANAMTRLGIKPAVAAAAPAGAPPMPIGGGGSSIPAQAKTKFANNDDREAAMLEAARQVLSQNS